MRICLWKTHQGEGAGVRLEGGASGSLSAIHHRCHREKNVEFVTDIRRLIYIQMSASHSHNDGRSGGEAFGPGALTAACRRHQ